MDQTASCIDEKPLVGGIGGGGAGTNISVELCLVCGDRASGRHYGAISCEGCKGFFKRSIRKQLGYQCRGTMNCEVTKHHRNRCQFCRLQKCLASGMRSDSVQHERKPIVDKKEHPNSGSTGSTTTASNPSSGGGSSNSLYHHHHTAAAHHHRSKLFNHSSGVSGLTGSTSIASAGVSAGVAAAAAAVAAVGASENLGNSVFPVGFNFADLTQTLILAATPYQQQQQQHQQSQQSSQQQDSGGYSYSPGPQTMDEDSMDNSTTGGGLVLSDQSTPSAAAAAGLIQSSIDKNLITESLDMIAAIQQQYDRSNLINNNNNNTSSNNNNNLSTTSSQSHSFNNIVKEELIIDDHQGPASAKIDDTDQDRDRDDHNIDLNDHYRGLFEMPLLPESNVSFNLQIPTLVPSYLNVHYVCESGSRLLFLSVYWIKKIQTFQQLPDDIKIKLLRQHWVELFSIGLVQCSQALSISTIMSTLVNNIIQLSELDKVPAIKIRKLSEHTFQLNEFVQTVQSMDLDDHEYAFIRLIIIFSPDNLNIKDPSKRDLIEKLQDHALKSLKRYLIEISYPDVNERCNKILLRLMQLRSLESDLIEELFFSNLIGHVQIENMIPYILKLGGGGI